MRPAGAAVGPGAERQIVSQADLHDLAGLDRDITDGRTFERLPLGRCDRRVLAQHLVDGAVLWPVRSEPPWPRTPVRAARCGPPSVRRRHHRRPPPAGRRPRQRGIRRRYPAGTPARRPAPGRRQTHRRRSRDPGSPPGASGCGPEETRGGIASRSAMTNARLRSCTVPLLNRATVARSQADSSRMRAGLAAPRRPGRSGR